MRAAGHILMGFLVSACLISAACGDDADADASNPADGRTPGGPAPTTARDAGPPAASHDAGADAAMPADAGAHADASASARDASDTGTARDGASPDDDPDMPTTLAQSGLYASGSTTELAPGVVAYAPAYALWSDGADKSRWLLLPEGQQIDTRDMAYWEFPVGTKSWKEFRKDGKRLETRLLWKTGMGWLRMAFVWNDDETEALAAPNGMRNVRGTQHDVPARGDCGDCHDSVPDRLLGVGAIQLSGNRTGLTLGQLIADGRLSDPPVADFALPDEPGWNALGYLHANCGNCHNPRGEAYDRLDMDLWLRPDQLASIEATESYTTTVGAALTDTVGPANRIEPGSAVDSGLIFRMSMRGTEESMPPLGSEQSDADGTQLVSDWINAL